ncbi:MAG: universal stress protein [Gammaproteobacteria bacterium]|nr:universal stress protein [Gammaproteobacteria bacterium]MCY4200106.1 universal stress protein [Gammaproteobacteria bacterium]MCY4278029.1 universal stress protein [Gammaproteobacteria bacterium]MCY4322174.1 universal stress protein [Gammaproteobacteria bacterium]
MTGRVPDLKRILLASDLAEDARLVAARARMIADACHAELHIIHVIEPFSLNYGGEISIDLSSVQDQIHDQATAHLGDLAGDFAIAEHCRHLVFGTPEAEIHKAADTLEADLIVVGTHGRHGIALLFGSQSTSVLHGANCDVLAVRVPDR